MPTEGRGKSAYPLRRISTTDFTSTAFTAKTPTSTKPSGNGVIDLRSAALGLAKALGEAVDDQMLVQPYGTNAANENFHMRVWGWAKGSSLDSTLKDSWIPILLGEFVVTLGSIDASDPLGSTMFLADTITESSGDTAAIETVSPTNDLPAWFVLDTRGCELIEFDFDLDAGGNAAASANCLWRTYSN